MIKLTWRQFRMQALVALVVVLVVGVTALATRPHLVSLISAAGDAPAVIPGAYLFLRNAFIFVAIAAPVLVGVFWGAPLVAHELETGTFRLAWTQSVSRTRWLATKLAVVGLAAILVTGLISLIVTWWSNPMNGMALMNSETPNRFGLLLFSAGGTAPLGYGAFGFMLGVAAGLLLRRTLAAIAATFVGFAAVRLAVTYWVRPHFMAPAQESFSLTSSTVDLGILKDMAGNLHTQASAHIPNAWIYVTDIFDSAGNILTSEYLQSIWVEGNPGALRGSLAATHHALVTFQPADRFWAFQGIETAVFLGLAFLLAGLCLWWLRRRIT